MTLHRRRYAPLLPQSPSGNLLFKTLLLVGVLGVTLPVLVKVATFWRQGLQKTAFVTRLDEVNRPRKGSPSYRYTLEIEGRHYVRTFSVGLPEHRSVSILVMPDNPHVFLLGTRQGSFWAVCRSNGISFWYAFWPPLVLAAFLRALITWLQSRRKEPSPRA